MSQRVTRSDLKHRKRTRRLIRFGWIGGTALLVIFLLYYEKSDWLYVLATLGITVLLVIVALADLGGGRKGVDEASLGDDSAALGSGIPPTMPAVASAPSDFRGSKTRRK
ncbi:MAG TPA: hypothetical protein VF791_00200 [Pyrinomonadaceae bacterium]